MTAVVSVQQYAAVLKEDYLSNQLPCEDLREMTPTILMGKVIVVIEFLEIPTMVK